MNETPRVVVGIDGSPTARRALQFAIGEARLRRLPLTVVTTWELPPVVSWSAAGDVHGLGQYLREAADSLLAAARDEVPDGVDVTTTSAEGHPAAVLIDAAADPSDILVVGSRGLGAVRGLLLGSVANACVARARCTVVVVHADPEP